MTPRFFSILVLSFVFGAAASLAPARANCFEDCQNTCRDLSGHISDACVDTCNRAHCDRPTVSYGAIAYGAQSTANGYAFGKGNAGDADRTALANCRQHGNDCKVVASFANSCVAVAAVESKGRFATGQAATRDQAQANAMSACKAQIAGTCVIEVWTCAFP